MKYSKHPHRFVRVFFIAKWYKYTGQFLISAGFFSLFLKYSFWKSLIYPQFPFALILYIHVTRNASKEFPFLSHPIPDPIKEWLTENNLDKISL